MQTRAPRDRTLTCSSTEITTAFAAVATQAGVPFTSRSFSTLSKKTNITMSHKEQLRLDRAKTVINLTPKEQEKELSRALLRVEEKLRKTFPAIQLSHQREWRLADFVPTLRKLRPSVDFHYNEATSSMKPNGGILSILNKQETDAYPILISEKLHQGAKDLRKPVGLPKQATKNAIERLSKNVIGFRVALLTESIFPFVCFGDGCDFADGSSILDRVVTIAMFGKLNTEYLHNVGLFNRGTFYFKVEQWTSDEMFEKCYAIAKKSVYYYFSKYGKENFI
jgi:type II restriction enzyme